MTINYPYMGQTFDEDVPVFCVDQLRRATTLSEEAKKAFGCPTKASEFLDARIGDHGQNRSRVAAASETGLQAMMGHLPSAPQQQPS